MRSFKLVTIIFAAAVLLTAFWGCSDKDENPTNSNGQGPVILSVSPTDGVVGVAKSAPISIRFSQPMDTASVRSNFYLSGGTEMSLWMDSLGHHMMMSNMSNMEHMMEWLDTIKFEGHFEWDSELDSCAFFPASPLMENTDHMIMLRSNMENRNGMMMNMKDYQLYHFKTEP